MMDLPPWYHPLKRDEVIRGAMQDLGVDVDKYPRYLALYGLRSELVAAAEAAQAQPSTNTIQEQGE